MLQRALIEHANNTSEFITKVSNNDSDIMKYAFWMAKTESVDKLNIFASVRERYPGRFMELCQLHLSTIVDIPNDYFDRVHEANFPPPLPILQSYGVTTGQNGTTSKWHGLNSLLKTHFNHNDALKSRTIKSPGELLKPYVEPLMNIMDFIDTPENLCQEGIFRKTGSIVRQREMKNVIMDHIMSKRPLNLRDLNVGIRKTRSTARMDPKINIHDICSVLKCILNELPAPLLTESMLPKFNDVALLSVGRTNDLGYRVPLRPAEEVLAIAKQLKAIRILLLYLPEANATLLKRLFTLLTNVLKNTKSNLMSAESLGTLFGLLLFSPGNTSNKHLQTVYPNFSRLATIMIKQDVQGLFTFPLSLSNDLQANCLCSNYDLGRYDSVDSGLESCETATYSVPSDSDSNFSNICQPIEADLPALSTTLAFTCRVNNSIGDKTTTPVSHQKDETEFAVSELYAAVHTMPDTDSRKRRLVQKFNATNGGLTPVEKILPKSENSKKTPSRFKSIKRKIAFRQADVTTSKVYSPTPIDADYVLCCPLVESICSPFRKKTDTPKSRKTVKRSKTSKTGNRSYKYSKKYETDETSIILDGQYFPSSESGSLIQQDDMDMLENDFDVSFCHGNEHLSYLDDQCCTDWLSDFVAVARMRRTRSLGDISNIF